MGSSLVGYGLGQPSHLSVTSASESCVTPDDSDPSPSGLGLSARWPTVIQYCVDLLSVNSSVSYLICIVPHQYIVPDKHP